MICTYTCLILHTYIGKQPIRLFSHNLIVEEKHSWKFGRPRKNFGNNLLSALVVMAFLTPLKVPLVHFYNSIETHYINCIVHWFLEAKEDVILSSDHCEGSQKCDMEWDLKEYFTNQIQSQQMTCQQQL